MYLNLLTCVCQRLRERGPPGVGNPSNQEFPDWRLYASHRSRWITDLAAWQEFGDPAETFEQNYVFERRQGWLSTLKNY